MTASSLFYQDFTRSPKSDSFAAEPEEGVEVLLARARGQARAEGFEEGLAQAEARFDAELQTQLAAVAAAIDEARSEAAGRTEAQIASLQRLMGGVLKALAPRLAVLNLVDEVIEAVSTAARAAPDETIVIETSADQRDAIESALSSVASGCVVEAAGDLSSAEARVNWRGGFDAVDAMSTAQIALETLDRRLAAAAKNSLLDEPQPSPEQQQIDDASSEIDGDLYAPTLNPAVDHAGFGEISDGGDVADGVSNHDIDDAKLSETGRESFASDDDSKFDDGELETSGASTPRPELEDAHDFPAASAQGPAPDPIGSTVAENEVDALHSDDEAPSSPLADAQPEEPEQDPFPEVDDVSTAELPRAEKLEPIGVGAFEFAAEEDEPTSSELKAGESESEPSAWSDAAESAALQQSDIEVDDEASNDEAGSDTPEAEPIEADLQAIGVAENDELQSSAAPPLAAEAPRDKVADHVAFASANDTDEPNGASFESDPASLEAFQETGGEAQTTDLADLEDDLADGEPLDGSSGDAANPGPDDVEAVDSGFLSGALADFATTDDMEDDEAQTDVDFMSDFSVGADETGDGPSGDEADDEGDPSGSEGFASDDFEMANAPAFEDPLDAAQVHTATAPEQTLIEDGPTNVGQPASDGEPGASFELPTLEGVDGEDFDAAPNFDLLAGEPFAETDE